MRGAREAPAPRDSLNFRRASLLSRNEFKSGTFTIVLHANSSFTYVSVIYGANFPFNCLRVFCHQLLSSEQQSVQMCVCVCVCVCVCQRKTKDRADGMREKSAHCLRRDSNLYLRDMRPPCCHEGRARLASVETRHFRHSPVSSTAKQSCMKNSNSCVCVCLSVCLSLCVCHMVQTHISPLV